MVQLFLNNSECDLYGKETIATDYSIAPISDISSRTSAKSITFKIPLTANNRAIIENANVIVNSTELPYRLIPAILKAGGLPQGIEFAQIKSIQDDIEVVLYGSNIDFFSIIKGLKLSDLGDVWNHDWTVLNAYNSRNNTSGYIYAMIDFMTDAGDNSNPYIDIITPEIDVRGLLPSVYLHSIISEIITQAGFTAEGDFLTDANYKSVIIPFTRFPTELHFIDSFDFEAGDTLGLTSIIPLVIAAGTDGVVLKAGSTVTIRGITNTADMIVLRLPSDLTLEAAIIAWFHFEVVQSSGLTYNEGFTNFPDSVVTFVVGDDYNITFDLTFENPTNDSIDIDYGFVYDTVFPVFFDYTIIREFRFGDDYGSYLTSECLPDMKQSDILKDTAQKFGLIFQVNNATQTVHIRRFSEIIENIPNALDWSEKVDYSEKPELQFDSGYARLNNCIYSEDDTVIKPAGTDSVIEIDNDNLEAENDLFKSPFAASQMVFRVGETWIANVKLWTAIGTAEEEIGSPEPRWLIVREQSYSPLFTWKDGTDTYTDTSAPVTHFILNGQSFNAGFENNLLDYSADLIALIQQYKSVKMLLRLTPADINQLDHFIPVWIELNGQPGCYFYVSKIKQFKVTSKESTEVELVKLN